MLNVLTVTATSFTGIFIILIMVNLPQPAAAALVCSVSLSAAGHHALRCLMVQDQSPHIDLPDRDVFI